MASSWNSSSSAIASNRTNSALYSYRLDASLILLIIGGSSTGTIFSSLSLIRYCRYPSLRTHFTYIFHFALIFPLLAGLFVNPSLLIGYYAYAFNASWIFCKMFAWIGSFMYVGMSYSLLYAAIERHYLTFRQNGPLTWRRQIIPTSSIFVFSLITSAGFYLFPQCPYIPCVPCSAFNLKLLISWQAFSFYLPMISLIIVTLILILRVNRARQQIRPSHHRSRPSMKITIQLCIYIVWSLIYYCPPAFYSLFITIDARKYSSPVMRSISTIIGVIGVQFYPILTYLMFWGNKQDLRLARVQPH